MKNRLKDTVEKKKLVWLLAHGYLGFTAALLIISVIVFTLSNVYYNWLLRVPDVDSLMENKAFRNGRYDSVPVSNFLGSNGAFAVVTPEGEVDFATENFFAEHFTEGELECIQHYDTYSYVSRMDITSPEGQKEYLLVQYIYKNDGSAEEKVIIVGEDLTVKRHDQSGSKISYTEKEFAYLTGEYPEGFSLMQAVFYDSAGERKVLITMSETPDFGMYQEFSERANRIYFLLIPLYILALAAFLGWLSRKIKSPLVKLNHAVEDIAAGGFERIGTMNGPWEMRQIGFNMDRMADKLEQSERERTRLDAERQKLLADISHDFKTPITVISGYTQAIRDGKVPPEKTDAYLELIGNKASELTAMINSFHEFSKVEHPEFVLNGKKTDICEFMRSYMADRYEEIEISGLDLKISIPERKIDCMLDVQQMKRALDNIVYNSIKHSGRGTVLAVMVSEGEETVRIAVADDGKGIPEPYRKRIFEPFSRGDDSRHGDGSGLGLSITRSIIRAHGGTITLCDTEKSAYSTEFEIILKKI